MRVTSLPLTIIRHLILKLSRWVVWCDWPLCYACWHLSTHITIVTPKSTIQSYQYITTVMLFTRTQSSTLSPRCVISCSDLFTYLLSLRHSVLVDLSIIISSSSQHSLLLRCCMCVLLKCILFCACRKLKCTPSSTSGLLKYNNLVALMLDTWACGASSHP